jgi:Protein of unknown function (DUF2924)
VNAENVTPDGGAAPIDGSATDSPSGAPSLQLRLGRLQSLDGGELREEWRRLCRSEPPGISRDLLLRALAYRLQEREFGGLPKWAQQNLEGSTARADPVDAGGVATPKLGAPRLKPGARLVREWHGRTHTVAVLDDAFEFEGRRYRSLTQIAHEITGAHWSGPRFFGLAKRTVAAGDDPLPTPHVGLGGTISVGQAQQGERSIEARRETAVGKGPDCPRRGHRVKESAHG